MNTVTLTGNLAGDPELGHTESGVAYAKFAVANNGFVNGESVLNGFFDCAAWRAQAENVAATLRKGDPVVLTGRLRQNKWQAEDGSNRSRVEIEVLTIGPSLQFAERSDREPPAPVEPATLLELPDTSSDEDTDGDDPEDL